jgi:hypothetical protein
MDEQTSFEPQAVLPPRRASWNRLKIAVPAVALLGAVWIGSSGQHSAASTVDAQHDKAVAQASTAPAAVEPTVAARRLGSPYPSTVLGIEVRSLADLASSADGDVVVAVAGWYVARPALGCPGSSTVDLPDLAVELDVDADICSFWDRSGLLVATPNPAGSVNVGGANDHPYALQATPAVSVTLTPGVVVPSRVSDTSAGPAHVILIGQLVEIRQGNDEAISGRQLVVDRVVWADGVGRAPTTSVLPKLLGEDPLLSSSTRDDLASSSFGPTAAMLMETLVDPRTLAAVDPDAAAVVAARSPESQRIWYRRALGLDPAHAVPRWIAIDDATGDVIASGFVGLQPRPRLPADGVNVLTTK